MLTIAGSSLSGMAAAARLARLGHRVTLLTDDRPPEALPPVITLPATWKDLFKKSGAHLQTELNRAGLAWAEAPPAENRFADGMALVLPTERGAQFHALRDQLGECDAVAWRDLLDDLDHVWRTFRRHALEGREPVDAQARQALWLDRSIDDLAARLREPLAGLVRDLADDGSSPALLALPLVVERSFGRWHLVDASGAPQPSSRLVDLLSDRLRERGVESRPDDGGPVDIDCRPPGPGFRPRPRTAAEWLERTPIVGADGALSASAASPAGPEPWGQLASAALAVYELHERLTGQDCRPTNVNFTLPRLPR